MEIRARTQEKHKYTFFQSFCMSRPLKYLTTWSLPPSPSLRGPMAGSSDSSARTLLCTCPATQHSEFYLLARRFRP